MPRSSVLHRNDEYTGIRVSKTANPVLVTIHDQHREGEFHRSPDLLGFAASSSLRPPHIDDEEVRQVEEREKNWARSTNGSRYTLSGRRIRSAAEAIMVGWLTDWKVARRGEVAYRFLKPGHAYVRTYMLMNRVATV